jgi:CBS domain-containing protein
MIVGIEHWVKDVVTVGEDDSVMDAAKIIKSGSISALVIEKDSRPVGIITDKDITGAVADELDLKATLVGDVMTRQPMCIEFSDSIATARNNMLKNDFRHMPVVDSEGKLMGIVSLKDLVRIWEDNIRK